MSPFRAQLDGLQKSLIRQIFDAAPPGPRRYPVVDERRVAAVTAPFGTVSIPEHGLRAVILDLVTPSSTTVSLRVDVGDEQAETEVLLRGARDGMTAIPIAGEHLVAGGVARVHVTFEANGEIVHVGTVEGELALGSVGGALDGSLVWTHGALVVTRPTARAVWEGEGSAVVTVAIAGKPFKIPVEQLDGVPNLLGGPTLDAHGTHIHYPGKTIDFDTPISDEALAKIDEGVQVNAFTAQIDSFTDADFAELPGGAEALPPVCQRHAPARPKQRDAMRGPSQPRPRRATTT